MHDIDRAMFEVAQHEGLDEVQAYEAHNQMEALETQLAAELLEVADEEELDRYLGDLVKKAASTASGFARSQTGQALTGLLKNTVKQALPQAGRLVGDAVAPGMGGQWGATAGQWLARQFESEGLSGEDRELAGARSLVRVATQATRDAVSAGPGAPPVTTATSALVAAANRNAPALVPAVRQAAGSAGAARRTPPGPGQRSSGRWVRRGRRIVLLNL